MPKSHPTLMRIGELSRRTRMAEATLRAWERRYGIPRPQRTVGGHRLYSDQDVVRLARVQRLVEQGWGVGAAARRVGREVLPDSDDPSGAPAPASADHDAAAAELVDRLGRALAALEGLQAHAVLDQALRDLPVTVALDAVVAPTLAALAPPDAQPLEAARGCFGRTLVRARLAGLLADMTPGAGDAAVCWAVDVDSELDALMWSIALAGEGWAVRHMGGQVRPEVAAAAADAVGAGVLVAVAAAGVDPAALAGWSVADDRLVVLAGPGAAELEAPPAGRLVRLGAATAGGAAAVRAQVPATAGA